MSLLKIKKLSKTQHKYVFFKYLRKKKKNHKYLNNALLISNLHFRYEIISNNLRFLL